MMDRNKAKAYWRRFTLKANIEGQPTDVMDFNNFVNAITEWENSSRVELPVILQLAEELREMINEAFDDMTVFYAPDECGKKAVKQLSKKINSRDEYGQRLYAGTLHYISTKNNRAIVLLEEIVSKLSK